MQHKARTELYGHAWELNPCMSEEHTKGKHEKQYTLANAMCILARRVWRAHVSGEYALRLHACSFSCGQAMNTSTTYKQSMVLNFTRRGYVFVCLQTRMRCGARCVVIPSLPVRHPWAHRSARHQFGSKLMPHFGHVGNVLTVTACPRHRTGPSHGNVMSLACPQYGPAMGLSKSSHFWR